jgi:hypothetical protein
MSYSIVSGYHCRPNSGLDWFYPIWWENTLKGQPKANKIFVIAMSGCRIPGALGDWIHLDADAQLFKEHQTKVRINVLVICTGALLCWLNGDDMIYKEQDLLAFGPWTTRMYEELGTAKVTFGKYSPGSGHHIAQNSLMLIKHEFLLDYVKWNLEMADGNHMDAERNHFILASNHPETARFYSFGYDRERPFNMDDPVWTAQKISIEELKMMRDRGLIDFDGEPRTDMQFTNNPYAPMLDYLTNTSQSL